MIVALLHYTKIHLVPVEEKYSIDQINFKKFSPMFQTNVKFQTVLTFSIFSATYFLLI